MLLSVTKEKLMLPFGLSQYKGGVGGGGGKVSTDLLLPTHPLRLRLAASFFGLTGEGFPPSLA